MMPKIAVVLPCYRSKKFALEVINRIGDEVDLIIAVDDACPEQTGSHVEANCRDPRVLVLRNSTNLGVGGAVVSGYRAALEQGADIIVKIDSDGQMDPEFLPRIVHPLIAGIADYSKGNRFYNVEDVRGMPRVRIFGNAVLSFLSKLSTGYWNIFDPTNGYTAIHTSALAMLPLDKIDRRYFFESDLLFRLYTVAAVVVDVPMKARYGEEESNLRVPQVVGPFLIRHFRNLWKRIFYRYFLRDMNIASLELLGGTFLLLFGGGFGIAEWVKASEAGLTATAGTVMLAGLPIITGFQLILSFFAFDFAAVPRIPLQVLIGQDQPRRAAGPAAQEALEDRSVHSSKDAIYVRSR